MGRSSGSSKGKRPGRLVRDVPVFDSYARLSWNPNTRELEKIEDQLADNARVISGLGGAVGKALSDGLSAWKRSVRRPGWEELLARVESGDSDGIVVWHVDRLFRQPRDLERLIELGEQGFTVASAHGTRNLASAEDRFILRIEVAQAAKSSDDKSRRVKERFEGFRARGRRTGGRRAFGFPGYVPLTRAQREDLEERGEERPVVAAEQVERERQALREASLAAAEGVPDSQIAREWNQAGIRTVWGRTWVQTAVRDVLVRPINAGLIEYDGEVVGKLNGVAIVDAETFARVRARVTGRRRGRAYGERYLGTGILRCGLCKQPLSAHPVNRNKDGETVRVYYCPKQRRGCGRISADVRGVEVELKAFVLTRLSNPEHAAAVNAKRARSNSRLAEVRVELQQCIDIQKALAQRLARREITPETFDESNLPLMQDIDRLTAERDSLPGGSSEDSDEEINPDAVHQDWKDADLTGKRDMLRQAIGPGQSLLIDPASGQRGRGKGFNRDRLRLDLTHRPTTE